MPEGVTAGAAGAGVSEGAEHVGAVADDGAVDLGEDAGARAADAGDLDADDDHDEDDYSDVPFKEDPQFKKVLAKLKKRNRQLSKLRPLASRVKDLDLDTVLSEARSARELRNALAGHPDLADEVMRALAGTRKPAAAEGSKPKTFDRTKLPFNTEDESGKFFADFYEKFLALEDELRSTKEQLATVRGRSEAQSRQAEMSRWQGAVRAAAAQVPDWARDMFNDAVYGAFAEAQKRGARIDPQRVIKHYLSKLPIGDKAKAAASAASAQRIAQNNSNLPRVPANAGQPAGARKTGETVADVNRRLRNGYFPR